MGHSSAESDRCLACSLQSKPPPSRLQLDVTPRHEKAGWISADFSGMATSVCSCRRSSVRVRLHRRVWPRRTGAGNDLVDSPRHPPRASSRRLIGWLGGGGEKLGTAEEPLVYRPPTRSILHTYIAHNLIFCVPQYSYTGYIHTNSARPDWLADWADAWSIVRVEILCDCLWLRCHPRLLIRGRRHMHSSSRPARNTRWGPGQDIAYYLLAYLHFRHTILSDE